MTNETIDIEEIEDKDYEFDESKEQLTYFDFAKNKKVESPDDVEYESDLHVYDREFATCTGTWKGHDVEIKFDMTHHYSKWSGDLVAVNIISVKVDGEDCDKENIINKESIY